MFDRKSNRVPTPPEKIVHALTEWARRIRRDLEKSPSHKKEWSVPSSVIDAIRLGLNSTGRHLDSEIARCFGIDDVSELVRKGDSESTQIIFQTHVEREPIPLKHELTISRSNGSQFRATSPNKIILPVTARGMPRLHNLVWTFTRMKDMPAYEIWNQIETLIHIISPHVFGPLHNPSFYLPADRTGVMHAHSVVVSALIGRAPMAGLQHETPMPALSGVLADFLQQLIKIGSSPYQPINPLHELGTQIETSILGGSVQVNRPLMVDYPYFSYQPDLWKESLPLMNASSMVSELAPVVLYLRHVIEPGNVLIIEEPESHLHPSMQVELIRQISALVNAGVKVIVTTHSEWLLEELANIVQRSKLSESYREKLPAGDFALRRDQVGAWLFRSKKRPRGSEVSEICLDDSGLYESDFGDVAAELHNNWAELSSLTGEKG